MGHACPLTADDRVLQKTQYVSDVSVFEFAHPLRYGAGLIVAKHRGHEDPEYLVYILMASSISIVHFVPSMLDVFFGIATKSQLHNFPSIRRVHCSGEYLSAESCLKCL